MDKGRTAFYRRKLPCMTTKDQGVCCMDAAGFITGLLIISLGILLSYILEKRHRLGKKQES